VAFRKSGGTIAANAANAAKPLQDGTPDCGYCPPSPPPIAAIAAQTPQEETPSGKASAAIAANAAIDSPLLSKTEETPLEAQDPYPLPPRSRVLDGVEEVNVKGVEL
jgi:hypothetical protein